MKTLKSIFKQFILLFFASAIFSCSDDDTTDNTNDDMEETEEMTIAEFVASSDDYSMLLAAVEYAGLTDALNDEAATLTVFAPNNDAFATWLTENGIADLMDVDADVVAQLLLNHVIGAELDATTVTGAVPTYQSTLATGPTNIAGDDTNVSIFIDSDLMVNGQSEITGPDAFDASNGIIHAVDTVITLPLISTFATADSRISTLASVLISQELVSVVDGLDPATVFAPVDAAFSALTTIPEGEALDNVLTYHVISGVNAVASDVISLTETPETVQGQTIEVTSMDPTFTGNANTSAASVVIADIQAINGVIHVIDTVLLPANEMQ